MENDKGKGKCKRRKKGGAANKNKKKAKMGRDDVAALRSVLPPKMATKQRLSTSKTGK
jgi:hypothetical protein